jgi:hypothetical protein
MIVHSNEPGPTLFSIIPNRSLLLDNLEPVRIEKADKLGELHAVGPDRGFFFLT